MTPPVPPPSDGEMDHLLMGCFSHRIRQFQADMSTPAHRKVVFKDSSSQKRSQHVSERAEGAAFLPRAPSPAAPLSSFFSREPPRPNTCETSCVLGPGTRKPSQQRLENTGFLNASDFLVATGPLGGHVFS